MSETFLPHDTHAEPLNLLQRLWGVFLLPVPTFTALLMPSTPMPKYPFMTGEFVA